MMADSCKSLYRMILLHKPIVEQQDNKITLSRFINNVDATVMVVFFIMKDRLQSIFDVIEEIS